MDVIFACRQLVGPSTLRAYKDSPAVKVCPPECKCARCGVLVQFLGGC